MTTKANEELAYARYKAIYDATKRGRHFLSGRFLKLNETKHDSEQVFDKRASDFIHFGEAVVEHLIEATAMRTHDVIY